MEAFPIFVLLLIEEQKKRVEKKKKERKTIYSLDSVIDYSCSN